MKNSPNSGPRGRHPVFASGPALKGRRMSVKGRLKDMSLVDILYIFHMERKTAALHLGSDKGYGKVFMKEGEVVHASFRKLSGLDAFHYLLSWKDGDFEVEASPGIPEATIAAPLQSILLDGLRRLDEAKPTGHEPRAAAGVDQGSLRLMEHLLSLGIIEKSESSDGV